MTDLDPGQVMTIKRFEELSNRQKIEVLAEQANQAKWWTAADSRKPVALGFKMNVDCPKCSASLPAGSFCKGIACPLNPAQQPSRIKAQQEGK